MTLVVDASVAVKWYLAEQGSEAARALVEQEDFLFAPDLLYPELANVLWKRRRKGEIEAEQARAALADLPETLQLIAPSAPVIDEALALAIDLDHPVYDCLYLAMALRWDCKLVTADRRFHGRVGVSEWRGRVELLGHGDHPPAPAAG